MKISPKYSNAVMEQNWEKVRVTVVLYSYLFDNLKILFLGLHYEVCIVYCKVRISYFNE
jgi:hypothetical protein